MKQLGHRPFGAGDHRRIEAEQQPAQPRHEAGQQEIGETSAAVHVG